jgi:hypothetical protein
MYTDSDKVWKEFLSACMARPTKCVLAKYASFADDLERKMDDLFTYIKDNPIPAKSYIIDYSLAKKNVLSLLYYPSKYATLAVELEALLLRNTTLLSALASDDALVPGALDPEALSLIRCSDKFLRTSNVNDVRRELRDKIYANSVRFGEMATDALETCAQWGFVAKERYNGNFRVKPSFPPLVIGNTWDPVTPLKSARNISALFEGSVLLQHNGHGVRDACDVR